MTSEDRVHDLAARIVDRRPIDWESETGENEEMSTQIRNLRTLERIRALHLEAAPAEAAAAPGDIQAERVVAAEQEGESTPTRPIPGEGAPAGRTSTSTGSAPSIRSSASALPCSMSSRRRSNASSMESIRSVPAAGGRQSTSTVGTPRA